MSDEAQDEGKQGRFAVLDVFGLKLEVSNPRLAELLTMDYRDALGSDVKDLLGPQEIRERAEEVAEAVPDIVLAATTPRDEEGERVRMAMRQRVADIGEHLGFDVDAGGLWESPTGITIMTRLPEGAVTLAAAIHFVTELAGRRDDLSREDATMLFVVDSQQSADVFKVAIRQRRLYHLMRTISLANLETVAALHGGGDIDHAGAVILLTPVAAIDVGEIMSVLRADRGAQAAS